MLNEKYTTILKYSIIPGDQHMHEREKLSGEFELVVGFIVILFDTLPVPMLARLIDIQQRTVRQRIRRRNCILDIPMNQGLPVRLLHPPFRDFLLDEQRCLDAQFWVHKEKATMSCLKLLSKHLKRDLCNCWTNHGAEGSVRRLMAQLPNW